MSLRNRIVRRWMLFRLSPVAKRMRREGLTYLRPVKLVRIEAALRRLGQRRVAGDYLEFSIEGPDYYPWQEGLYVESPYAVSAGTVRVPDAPGWGVEISPRWLERAQYTKSALP